MFDKGKYFSLEHAQSKPFLNIFDTRFLTLKKKSFLPYRKSMPNVICDLVLYLQSEGLEISWTCPGTVPFQYLETIFTIQYSTSPLAGGQFMFDIKFNYV